MFVVIRYQDRDSRVVKTDYYLSNGAPQTPLAEFCRAAKAEHRIEECIQRGKGEAGLADYEVRNWIGWHHHQTLSLLASWFLNVETRRAEKKDACNYFQSSPSWHRLDPSRRAAMRYTPRRNVANRTTIASKPAGQALSLEKPYYPTFQAVSLTSWCIFGSIAADDLGYAKVAIEQAIAQGDPGCRVVVFLKPTPEAEAAQGREYFKG